MRRTGDGSHEPDDGGTPPESAPAESPAQPADDDAPFQPFATEIGQRGEDPPHREQRG